MNYSVDQKTFFIIAGPCVIESEEHCLKMAGEIKKICDKLEIPLIFKASFDKANRTSIKSFRGVGIEQGIEILKKVKDIYNVPILTDIHESWQCKLVAQVADILQIPAFLCRQTDLLTSAAETNKYINIKKGQFCSVETMKHAYQKIIDSGNNQIMITERGNMFGYGDLVVDFGLFTLEGTVDNNGNISVSGEDPTGLTQISGTGFLQSETTAIINITASVTLLTENCTLTLTLIE